MTDLEKPKSVNDHDVEKERHHLESINHLTEWKSTKLNIGVLGATSLQKHVFIQTLSGTVNHDNKPSNKDNSGALEEVDSDYQFVTPVEPIGHVHATNSNVIFWEMPESINLDRNEYIDLIQLERYDLLLICQCESREYEENDLYIADLVKSKGIPVFFVKFHCKDMSVKEQATSEVEFIDRYLINIITILDYLNRIYGFFFSRLEFQIIEKINNEFMEINSEPYKNHYVVSAECHVRFDLNKLMLDLVQSLNATKSETLIFSVEPFSRDLIEKKNEVLKSKTYHSAVVSTLCGIFTHIVPGVGLVADLGFLLQEIRFYSSQFNLHEEGLQKTARRNNIPYDDLMIIVNKSAYGSLIVLKDMHTLTSVLVRVLPIFAAASALDTMKMFPVVGHIIHGTMSFLMTKIVLIKILDEFCNVALEINDLIESKQRYDHAVSDEVSSSEASSKEKID